MHLATPRTEGLDGDWSAKAVNGTVVADRAFVSDDNSALDLRTGKTVTLGSVHGGTPFVADDRLIIASAGRIDSVRLDATARWTWNAPTGMTATPLAARSGSTLVAACPTFGTCTLFGLDDRGAPAWRSEGASQPGPADRSGSLPQVAATAVAGGGLVVTDPVSGRSALRAGRSSVAIPSGPVVTELPQNRVCVVAAYSTADALWTRVVDDCGSNARPEMSLAGRTLTLRWPGKTQHLDLVTGRPMTQPVAKRFARAIASTTSLVATASQQTLHTNPFRWGRRVTVIKLRDAATGDLRAQLVSDEPLTLLQLHEAALVVREGGRVVRYTLADQT